MKRYIIPYNPKLKTFAKTLRQNMTLAEVLLWKQLRKSQVEGCDFDRQRPVGEYIVDFFCKELRLAIEVDGHSHDFKLEEDQERDSQLRQLGVHVLRFWDHDVKNDMDAVVAEIRKWIRENGEPTPRFADPSQEGNSKS